MIRIDKEWLEYGNNFIGMMCCLQLSYRYTNLKVLKSQMGLGDTLIRTEIDRCVELDILKKDKYNNYLICEYEFDKYISIVEEDFVKIWDNCPKALKYFCCLMESRYGDKLPTVDEPYKVGFMPRSYFADIMGCWNAARPRSGKRSRARPTSAARAASATAGRRCRCTTIIRC